MVKACCCRCCCSCCGKTVKAKKNSASSATTETEVAGVPLSGNKGATKEKKRKRVPTEKKRKDMEDEPFGVYGRISRPRILPEGSRTLYATNLPPRVTIADFEIFFQEYGKIDVEIFPLTAKAEFDSHKFGKKVRPSLAAKIEFESHDVAKKALEDKHRAFFIARWVMLDTSLTPERVQCNVDNLAERVIYVCGFGKTVSPYLFRKELKELFSSCGEIRMVKTPQNKRTSLFLGYAFIIFKDVESTTKALEKDGTKVMNYTLQVRRAKVELDVEYI